MRCDVMMSCAGVLVCCRDLRNSGMSIVLSKEIPDAIYQNIGRFTADMIASSPMPQQAHAQAQGAIPFKELTWALHPGGPMILQVSSRCCCRCFSPLAMCLLLTACAVSRAQAISDCLGLSRDDTWASWDVLRRYGNMSSATLIFVLDELRKKKQKDVSHELLLL